MLAAWLSSCSVAHDVGDDVAFGASCAAAALHGDPCPPPCYYGVTYAPGDTFDCEPPETRTGCEIAQCGGDRVHWDCAAGESVDVDVPARTVVVTTADGCVEHHAGATIAVDL
jgi:hypothetical protein